MVRRIGTSIRCLSALAGGRPAGRVLGRASLLCAGLLIAMGEGAQAAITLTDTTNLSLAAHQTESGGDTTENPDVTGGGAGALVAYAESGSFTCCGAAYLGDNLDDGDVGAGNASDGTYAIPDADGVAQDLVLDFGSPQTIASIAIYNGYANRDDGSYTLKDAGGSVIGAWTIATVSNGTNDGADSFWLTFPTPVTTSSLTLEALSSDAEDTVSYREIQVRAAPVQFTGVQLYRGSWIAESFGNDEVSGSIFPESQRFSVFGVPQGQLCAPNFPRCPFSRTPVSVQPPTQPRHWDPLGTFCTPNSAFGYGPTRPVKGGTPLTFPDSHPIPPLYRNPAFFTAAGSPKTTSCKGSTTVGGATATKFLSTHSPLRGKVMKGAPLTGTGTATAMHPRAFSFPAAPPSGGPGIRRTTQGQFDRGFPYIYEYTYATLRNGAGLFSDGHGFFTTGMGASTLSFPYSKGGVQAKVVVKKGANAFGGVMRLLGQVTTKVCYFRNGGCSLGAQNWLYQYIGVSGYKPGGYVTAPAQYFYSAMYYHTLLMQQSTVMVEAERFPWTTGSVTVTATGRGPHRTIERRAGYDNRTSGGVGTVQLVSPSITHWIQPAAKYETGGIAILRFEFLPEPRAWLGLFAGLGLLALLYGLRRQG